MEWISEADQLPYPGQDVFLALPPRNGGYWELRIARLLIENMSVRPQPVDPIGPAPDRFWWGLPNGSREVLSKVTGTNWWALFDDIPLPPGAEHTYYRGFHFVGAGA